MTRFAWLQSRTQTVTAVVLVAALAVVATTTGIHLSHLYSSLVAHCHTGCDLAASQFTAHDKGINTAFDLLALLAPALIGIFWGAPLVARELETNTYRLAWTQSVSRSRWLATKLRVGGLMAVVTAAFVTLSITWWSRALDTVASNQYDLFDRRDIAPIAYAAFAFAAGALIGAVMRRTVPAMAVTIGVYAFARTITTIVRPHFLSPTRKTMALNPDQIAITVRGTGSGPVAHIAAQGSGPPNSWTLSSHLVTDSGHVPSAAQVSAFVHQHCPGPGTAHRANVTTCANQIAQTFRVLVTYQPAKSYWTFQWIESGIFIVAATVAVIGCYWWVTQHTS
jgi:hypothetical protein